MVIRQYNQADINAVLDCWVASTTIAHPFFTEEFIAQERKNIEEIYIPNTLTWVISLNDEINGFITLMGNKVVALFIHPDFQGKGAGRKLLDTVQEIHGDLEVEVFSANEKARDFYSTYGFKYASESFHEPTKQSVLHLTFTP